MGILSYLSFGWDAYAYICVCVWFDYRPMQNPAPKFWTFSTLLTTATIIFPFFGGEKGRGGEKASRTPDVRLFRATLFLPCFFTQMCKYMQMHVVISHLFEFWISFLFLFVFFVFFLDSVFSFYLWKFYERESLSCLRRCRSQGGWSFFWLWLTGYVLSLALFFI